MESRGFPCVVSSKYIIKYAFLLLAFSYTSYNSDHTEKLQIICYFFISLQQTVNFDFCQGNVLASQYCKVLENKKIQEKLLQRSSTSKHYNFQGTLKAFRKEILKPASRSMEKCREKTPTKILKLKEPNV